MSEDPLIAIMILTPTFIIVSLISTRIISMKRLKPLRPLFTILLAPGTVLHEAGHYLMSRILGVHVRKVRWIEVDRNWNSGGCVLIDPIQNSFFKPFLIAFAPSLINTILACLLILIAPYLTEQWTELLVSWFIVSLILECAPSRSDLAVAVRPLAKYPKNSLKEIGCLALGILTGLFLYRISIVTIGVDLPPLLIAVFTLITTALTWTLLSKG